MPCVSSKRRRTTDLALSPPPQILSYTAVIPSSAQHTASWIIQIHSLRAGGRRVAGPASAERLTFHADETIERHSRAWDPNMRPFSNPVSDGPGATPTTLKVCFL